MKIQIIGFSGSGKSTFAIKLSKIFAIELVRMDRIFFKDNWTEKEDHEVTQALDLILQKSKWIIDGNYRKFYGTLRNQLADKIFIFEFSRIKCLINIIKRRIRYHKKVRPSSADNCIEKIDFSFIKWILKDGRTKKHKDYINEIKNHYSDKVVVFRRHKDVNRYLKDIKVK